MAPATRYAKTRDGVHIAYQVYGDGPVDLLHVPQSFSAIELLWEHPVVARFFERLSACGRLILFDRRGSGMSDRPGSPATLEEQMDDVIAVLDAAGSERAALFALLEGGPMAMLFAASFPERVRALTLYACFARTVHDEGYAWAPSAEQRTADMEAFHQAWGTGEVIERFAPSHADDPRLRKWLGKLQRMSMAPGMARAMVETNGRLDVRAVLSSIRVPTLVIHRIDDAAMNVLHSHYLAEHIPDAQLVLLPGTDTLPFLGDSEAVLGEIEEFLTGERHAHQPDRVLATVLVTDIVGSTELAASLGDRRWRDLLAEHDAVVRARVERHQGRVVRTEGDGVWATFDGPARAINAAKGIVADVEPLGISIRAGLHTGEVEVVGDGVAGVAVSIGERVADEAEGGEVVVSNTVKDLVVGSGLAFEPRGEQELEGIPGRWRLWAVTA